MSCRRRFSHLSVVTGAAVALLFLWWYGFGQGRLRPRTKVKGQQPVEDGRSKVDSEEAPYLRRLESLCDNMGFRFPGGASKVFEHLYLGGEDEATDLSLLHNLGITHVLNCAETYTMTGPGFYGDDIAYLGFEAEDDEGYDMMQHFPAAYQFIEAARKAGGKVLIHCLMGINRSGVLTVAYAMMHDACGPITATKFVKTARGYVLTNTGFQHQLVSFAREKGLLQLDKALVES